MEQTSPTRMNLLQKKAQLQLAQQGRELLEQKRQALMREFLKVVDVAVRESEELDTPRFTPATKAESGHDINISIEEMAGMVGADLTEELRRLSSAIYEHARVYARGQGIIIADTKFEFGLLSSQVLLIDECLTPDSSRFWGARDYRPGVSQPSFDKQYVRDWLTASGWNKEPPAPELPPDVVEQTAEKYREAFQRLTGQELSRTGG